MKSASWSIAVGNDAVSAVFAQATAPASSRIVYVCAHGAGGNMMDRGMLATANALRDVGMGVLRFNFPYKERKSGRPDPMPKLKDTVAAVVDHARKELA